MSPPDVSRPETSPPAPTKARLTATMLVLGDMHRHWRPQDREFIENGGFDQVLFVGDLGDEDVALVREVAALRAPKAVILGNHDAWQSFSRRRPTTRLLDSLDALGDDHLAYAAREIPQAGVSLVGARPFSWGGQSLRSPEVYGTLYNVRDMEQSAERIFAAARATQHRDLLVLAHNGPAGLSQRAHDIWGKDFGRQALGDWGDPDLAIALEQIERVGWRVPCVVAGHMHHRLHQPPGGLRERFVRRGDTLFVNAAVVPRTRPSRDSGELRHYLRLSWQAGALTGLEEIWVDAVGNVRALEQPAIVAV